MKSPNEFARAGFFCSLRSQNSFVFLVSAIFSTGVCLLFQRYFMPDAVLNKRFLLLPLTFSSNRLLVAILVILLCVLLLKFSNDLFKSKTSALITGIIAGSGFFNLFSRLFHGYVYDYINFYGLFWFNIADIMVCLGLFYFFIYVFIIDSSNKFPKRVPKGR